MLVNPPQVQPPENFAMVWRGVYRSGFPTKKNFGFLRQLQLRSVLFLCPEEYPESHLEFLNEEGVQLLQFGVTGNKEPFDEIPEEVIRAAVCAVMDARRQRRNVAWTTTAVVRSPCRGRRSSGSDYRAGHASTCQSRSFWRNGNSVAWAPARHASQLLSDASPPALQVENHPVLIHCNQGRAACRRGGVTRCESGRTSVSGRP